MDFSNLIQIKNNGSTILEIPKDKIETKLNLIIYHNELANIYSNQLYKKEYTDSTDYIVSDIDIKSPNNFINNKSYQLNFFFNT